MNRVHCAIKRAYCYSLLGMGALLLTVQCIVWGTISCVLFPLMPVRVGRRVGRLAAMRLFRLYLSILELAGAWRLDLSSLDALASEGALIIAPNHPGLLDAVLLVSRLPNAVCVMKASLLNTFLVGPAGRLARYVCNDTLLPLISTAGHEIRLGGQLVLFPEGTRTVGGSIGPFTAAVGALSRRTGVPVQTVIIETDSQFLGKEWGVLRCPEFPMHFRVRLGRRFDPPKDVRAFTGQLERYFRAELTAPAGALLTDREPGCPAQDAAQFRG
ncbi:MAG: 1-acyl-sn-glycerol-3-phosphate acyltransferase [Pseudomonadota bacterium]|nr:1-acyl-sn-glycerol-3-phosphate acyltransferase [Pseudomonadota bacterium]